MRFADWGWFWTGILMLSAGCGGAPERPETVQVTGKITQGGKPGTNLNIVFYPQNGQGRPASAVTDAEGAFSLGTFEPGDGAILGEHKVVISPISESPETNDEAGLAKLAEAAKRVPAAMQAESTTPFTFEVVTDPAKNVFEKEIGGGG